MKHKPIDVELMREWLDYDSESGELRWKKPRTGGVKAGDIAGTKLKQRGKPHQMKVELLGQKYQVHRVAWAIANGEDPGDKSIDHINRNPWDNRLSNLRVANATQQSWNRGIMRTAWGISRHRDAWTANIRHENRSIYIGRYDCPLMARIAYEDKRSELRGEWATAA